MTILTDLEASLVLRCETSDVQMQYLLPLVDEYVKNATGHDWATDAPIHNSAKAAARMLLVMWYENPAMIAAGVNSLAFGLQAALTQLEATA
ncbi:MAG: head-tail connector protein, partial [Anaerolineae bacterium]